MKKEKQKTITFSEEIDSSINGLALGISFLLLAVLVWNFSLFHNTIVDRIMEVVLIGCGIISTVMEFDKINKGDIKGIDDLILGVLFSSFAIFLIWKFDLIWLNVLGFAIALFGFFGSASGIIKIVYSLNVKKRTSDNKKIKIINLITLATEGLALVVVVLQLISELIN